MPRTCTVCTSDQRGPIEAALMAGTGYRDIARPYRVSKDALMRHRADHIAQHVAQAQEAREEAQALDVVKQLKAINNATVAILIEARTTHDNEMALKAIDRVLRQLELQAKLLGAIDERTQVNVFLMPDYTAARSALMTALAPYLPARIAAAKVLASLEGASNGHRG